MHIWSQDPGLKMHCDQTLNWPMLALCQDLLRPLTRLRRTAGSCDLVSPPRREEGSDVSMDAKSTAHKRGRPIFSNDEPVDSLHNDGESFILCLRCHEGRYDMLHRSYEGDHVSASAVFLGRWLQWFPNPVLGWLAADTTVAASATAFVFSAVTNLDSTLLPMGTWGPRSSTFSVAAPVRRN
jgi:hypothetical protein